MNILIYDNNINDLEMFCKLFDYLPFDTQINKLTESEDFKMVYDNEKFDIVFVDLNNECGRELLHFVLHTNPEQRLVTINNSFECFEEHGCDFCKSNYNKLRLVKPLNVVDLTNVIKGNKCKYEYCNEGLLTKLLVISKSHEHLNFNMEKMQFSYLDKSDFSLNIIELTQELLINGIKYEVYENYIQIIDEKDEASLGNLIKILKEIITEEFPQLELIGHEDEVILYDDEELSKKDIEKLNSYLKKYNYKFKQHNPSLAYLKNTF